MLSSERNSDPCGVEKLPEMNSPWKEAAEEEAGRRTQEAAASDNVRPIMLIAPLQQRRRETKRLEERIQEIKERQ